MNSKNSDAVAKCLREGLGCYGAGEVGRAFLLWREALELDPGNEEALAYMRDADRRSESRSGGGTGAPSIVDDARRRVHARDEEGALDLLMSAPAGRSLESEAMIELLRARLSQHYVHSLGGRRRIPRRVVGGSEREVAKLPASAGFLLSMVDGRTPLDTILDLCGMDPFDSLRAVHRMHRVGIVEFVA
jgi:hypothetical protein